MAYTLSNLLRDAVRQKGRASYRSVTATGGGTSTLICTRLGTEYSDDDASLVDGTVLITRDSAGAGAAPEGEFQRISSYDEETTTVTVDTAFSSSVGSGDMAMLITSEFPIEDLIALANQVLQDLGPIALPDTSLTTVAGTTEYTLPVALKFRPPLMVQVQTLTGVSGDNDWETIHDWYVTPSTPGSTALLVIPHFYTAGRTIKVWYEGVHPQLSAYSSVVSETIHEGYIAWALTAAIWSWTQPDNPLELRHMDAAAQTSASLGARYPIWKPARSPKFATFASENNTRYYPGDQSIYDR